MKKIQAPKVAAIIMQCGKLKMNLYTSNGFQKLCISWIDLKILPQKLDLYAQL